jgi:hypothetical protein
VKTKNAKAISRTEREHLERVKSLPCSICDAPGPSEAHHIEQGEHFSCVALCPDCHRGSVNGLHGQRVMWRIHKQSEVGALAVTVRRLMEAA